jgi:hypothetical protein
MHLPFTVNGPWGLGYLWMQFECSVIYLNYIIVCLFRTRFTDSDYLCCLATTRPLIRAVRSYLPLAVETDFLGMISHPVLHFIPTMMRWRAFAFAFDPTDENNLLFRYNSVLTRRRVAGDSQLRWWLNRMLLHMRAVTPMPAKRQSQS